MSSKKQKYKSKAAAGTRTPSPVTRSAAGGRNIPTNDPSQHLDDEVKDSQAGGQQPTVTNPVNPSDPPITVLTTPIHTNVTSGVNPLNVGTTIHYGSYEHSGTIGTHYAPTIAATGTAGSGLHGKSNSTFKPRHVTISEMVVLKSKDQFTTWKERMLAKSKMDGYYEYLVTDSNIHWTKLIQMYGSTVNITSLYQYYRETHRRIAGGLQLAMVNIIPNFTMFNESLAAEYPRYAIGTIIDERDHGSFVIDNATILWTKITSILETKSVHSLMTLYRQIFDLKYTESQDPMLYQSNFRFVAARIAETQKQDLNEAFLTFILVKSLPSSCNQISSILEANNKLETKYIFEQLDLKYSTQHPTAAKLVSTTGKSTSTVNAEANYADATKPDRTKHGKGKGKPSRRQYTHAERAAYNAKKAAEAGSTGHGKGSTTNKHPHQSGGDDEHVAFSAVDDEDEYFQNLESFSQHRIAGGSMVTDFDLDELTSDTSSQFAGNAASGSKTDEFTNMWQLKLDSGTTRHICTNRKLFIPGSITAPPFKYTMKGLYGSRGTVVGIGSIKLSSRITLNNVWYIPSAGTNLISVGKIATKGYRVEFDGEHARIIKNLGNSTIFEFHRDGELFVHNPMAGKHEKLEPDMVYDNSIKPGRIPRKGQGKNNGTTSTKSASSTTTSTSTMSTSTEARARLQKSRDTNAVEQKTPAGDIATGIAHYAQGVAYEAVHEPLDTSSGGGSVTGLTTTYGRLMHERLGHRTITKSIGHPLGVSSNDERINTANCETCMLTKTTRKPISTGTYTTATEPFERINVDLMGPISIRSSTGSTKTEQLSLGGNKYVLVMVDAASGFIWTYLLSMKSEAAGHIRGLIKFIRVQYGVVVKRIHSDNGREFKNETLASFFKANGIEQTFTTSYTPQHNGQAERTNRTIATMVRSMLQHGNLSPILWGEAILYAAYVHNRIPTRRLNHVAPVTKLTKGLVKADTTKIKIFGSNCIVNVSAHGDGGKFETQAVKGVFIGIAESQNAYRILTDNKVIISRDVLFIENKFTYAMELNVSVIEAGGPNATSIIFCFTNEQDGQELETLQADGPSLSENSSGTPETQISEEDTIGGNMLLYEITEETDSAIAANSPSGPIKNDIVIPATKITSRRGRTLKQTRSYGTVNPLDLDPISRYQLYRATGGGKSYLAYEQDQLDISMFTDNIEDLVNSGNEEEQVAFSAVNDIAPDPRTYKEAMQAPDAGDWKAAIETEIKALEVQQVLTRVKRPTGIRTLDTKWVFKKKTDEFGKLAKYKGRLVVRGFKQRAGLDFNQIFAPVVKSKSIKLLLTLAAKLKLEVHQLDFSSAFLNATLPEDIYISAPEGYALPPGTVFKLSKSLYGLRQAPFLWNTALNNLLVKLGYTRAVTDQCIYFKYITGCRWPIIISVYVDDVLILFDKTLTRNWIQDKLIIQATYKLEDLGNAHWILQMKVTRNPTTGDITLTQEAAINQLVKKWLGSNDIKVSGNPSMTSIDLSATGLLTNGVNELLDENQKQKYQSIVGSLLYFSNTTRIDISFVVNSLCKGVAAPTTSHMKVAVNVIRYLAGTSTIGLVFRAGNEIDLNKMSIIGFSDSDYAGDKVTRKSTSGTITKLGDAVITWSSKQQSTVALSTMEAEYTALVAAACDAIWLKQWLYEVLGIECPIRIYCDNQSTIHILANDDHHASTKHMDVRLHFIRDYINKGVLEVRWISTDAQVADVLTKNLDQRRFTLLRSTLML